MRNICPKCGEKDNLHFNYDYSQQTQPVINVLCNECGEQFGNLNDHYAEIETAIIRWTIDGTKTAGALTREIIEIIKK